MLKRPRLFFVFLLMSGAYSVSVSAETVRIPLGQESASVRGKLPPRGSTKQQVESRFGAPTSRDGPRGEPPIYFWEYPDFTVYFEADRVIHTVVKNRALAQ